MIRNLEKNQIPIILLNARFTRSSFKKWLIVKSFAKEIFNKISIAFLKIQKQKNILKFLVLKKLLQQEI